MLLQPVFNEGFNVSREFIPAACPGCVRELAEPYQDWHSGEHVAGRIAVFSQPSDIAFNRIADPTGTDSVEGDRTDKVAF
jgi:hypothetical protein